MGAYQPVIVRNLGGRRGGTRLFRRQICFLETAGEFRGKDAHVRFVGDFVVIAGDFVDCDLCGYAAPTQLRIQVGAVGAARNRVRRPL
jgi:hypothetical protein